jgi:hypothetical protein
MKKLLLLLLVSVSYFVSYAQVGVNTTNLSPDGSAMLDVASTTRGFLTPRMTTAQRNAVVSPANGLLVYNTTTSNFSVFKAGTGWIDIVSVNLPFSGTVSSANGFPNAAFRIINTNGNSGSAGAFVINNAANSGSALSTSTNGTGNAFRAEVSSNTAATAIFAHTTGSSLGAAGSFVNDNAGNTNVTVGVISNASNASAHGLTSTHSGGASAGVFTVNNAAATGSALAAFTNGSPSGRAFTATNSGMGSAGEFLLSDATNSSNALVAATGGDGYAASFTNTKADATNGGAIIASTGASTGIGYPNAIYASANGTLGTAGLFQSTNSGSIRPTLLALNEGIERTFVVSANNAAYPTSAVQINVGTGGTADSRGISVNQSGLGIGLEIQATNAASSSNLIEVIKSGTGHAIHAASPNPIGSAGLFEKQNIYNGPYTNAPIADLEVRHTITGNSGGMSGLRLYNTGGNNNSWTIYTDNNFGGLLLFNKNNFVGQFGPNGAYTNFSDARVKSNLAPVPRVLEKVMQLQAKTYNYVFDETKRPMLGFVAQDVEPLFPQLVYSNKTDVSPNYYRMDYSGFGVIAIKAVQEQQAIIQNQQQEINDLKKEIAEIKFLLKK